MNEQDREAIDRLFERLADAERQAGPKDVDADAYLKQKIERQPGATYMMAQTVVMQTYALEQAQQRIEELEEQLAERPSQSGMFGGNRTPDRPYYGGSVPATGRPIGAPAGMQPMGTPSGMPMQQPQAGGGGFLAGAAQTAMAVAGGMLLGNAIGGMFGGNSAHAAPAAATTPTAPEAPAAQPVSAPAEPAPEPAVEEGGGFLESIFGGFGFGGGDETDT